MSLNFQWYPGSWLLFLLVLGDLFVISTTLEKSAYIIVCVGGIMEVLSATLVGYISPLELDEHFLYIFLPETADGFGNLFIVCKRKF